MMSIAPKTSPAGRLSSANPESPAKLESPAKPVSPANVVTRLKDRLREARGLGFKVRLETLDGEQATWCEIGGIPTLFVDLSQTAAEQLRQLEETLAAYARRHAADGSVGSGDAIASPRDVELAKRVA